jgi:hypothetical protein
MSDFYPSLDAPFTPLGRPEVGSWEIDLEIDPGDPAFELAVPRRHVRARTPVLGYQRQTGTTPVSS